MPLASLGLRVAACDIGDQTFGPHSPVRLIVKANSRTVMVRQLKVPVGFSADLPFGPMPQTGCPRVLCGIGTNGAARNARTCPMGTVVLPVPPSTSLSRGSLESGKADLIAREQMLPGGESGDEAHNGINDARIGGQLASQQKPCGRRPAKIDEGSLRLAGTSATCPDGISEEDCKVEVSHRRDFGSPNMAESVVGQREPCATIGQPSCS